MPLFKFSMRTGAQKKDAKFHDVLQNKIFHNLISTCVVSQITIDHNRAFAPWHPHTESRVHSLSTYCQAVGLYAYRSLWNTSRYRVSICSRSWKIAAEVKEEDFFCHVTHKTFSTTYGKPMSMTLTARRITPLRRKWLWKSERPFNPPGIISERYGRSFSTCSVLTFTSCRRMNRSY